MSKVIGIDISKQTFDVSFREQNKVLHKVYVNTTKGFKQLIKDIVIADSTVIVMEASGPYYVCLANYLHPMFVKGYFIKS